MKSVFIGLGAMQNNDKEQKKYEQMSPRYVSSCTCMSIQL